MQTMIDLNADNVFQADMTVEKAKTLVSLLEDHKTGEFDDLGAELDSAQGEVSDTQETVYVVLTITK